MYKNEDYEATFWEVAYDLKFDPIPVMRRDLSWKALTHTNEGSG